MTKDNKPSTTDKDTSEFDRRSGTDLPEQPVTKDTDIKTVPESKDGEIAVPERTADANIARAHKLADENSKHDQEANRKDDKR